MVFTLVCCTGVPDVNDTTTEAATAQRGQSTEDIESSESAKTTEAAPVATETTSDEPTETNVGSEDISEAATNPPAEITTEITVEITTEASAEVIEQNEIKNIILIIGDGMGLDHIAAGQLASGEQYQFTSWQSVVCNTDSVSSSGKGGVLTDSAASATALATGTLTVNGYLGKDHRKKDLKTILDYAKESGKAVGIVTTDNLYGATPSGFSAHSTDRNASKVITKSQMRSGVDFFLGLKDDSVYGAFASAFADEGYYYSNSVADIDEALTNERVFLAIDIESGAENEITLSMATSYAIDFLEEDEDGYVLIIEQAYIDKCSHNNDFAGMIKRMDSLADTVDTVMKWIGDRKDTAVLVTADHETGGLAVSSSPILSGEYQGEDRTVYYTWGTGNHTDSNVGLFVYGFSPDFSDLEWYGSEYMIKNTEVFALMMGLLGEAEE
jgi:alkaline phosphatase